MHPGSPSSQTTMGDFLQCWSASKKTGSKGSMAPQLKKQMESRGLEVVAISDMKVLVKYAKKSQDEHIRLIRNSKRGDHDTGVLERFLNERLGGRQPPKEQPSVRILVSPRKANRKTNGTFSTQQTPDPDRIVVSPTAKYHLNIFNKELKPWLLENHEDEAWLFYPRGVGSRF